MATESKKNNNKQRKRGRKERRKITSTNPKLSDVCPADGKFGDPRKPPLGLEPPASWSDISTESSAVPGNKRGEWETFPWFMSICEVPHHPL